MLRQSNQETTHILVLQPLLWHTLVSYHKTADFATRKRLGIFSSYPCILSYIDVKRSTTKLYVNSLCTTPPSTLKVQSVDICSRCFCTDLRMNNVEGMRICINCGYFVEEHSSSTTSYNESYNGPQSRILSNRTTLPRVHASYIHKRCHHFRSWLKRIQGHECITIPPEDRERIQQAIIKYKFNSEPDYIEMRFILKRLKLQKYYNHVFLLINMFRADPMITLSKEHEDILEDMFRKLQKPFGNNRGRRVNMLSYSYILIKLCEHLGWEDLSNALPKLISPLKIYKQDQIWKLVCSSIDIPFSKSIL
jgi:hypothetical protein